MKEALAFIGILALAVSLWFLKEHSDKKIIESKNETIKSLQDTVQSKEDTILKNNALLDSGNSTIKSLKDTIQAKEDAVGKDKALLDAKDETIKSLQNDIQTKKDVIGKDKTDLDAKDETIKSLQATIVSYEQHERETPQGNEANGNEDNIIERVYPKDNGFDAQDLGSGFFAFQIFGPVKNPFNAKIPDKIPNHTPWKFGGVNSGITANNSGFYLMGATNRDSNGATSTSGQAGFLEFKDSSISQLVTLPAGTYTVTFDYEGRRDYPVNEIAVSIDDTVLFKGAPTDCNNFKRVTTRPITLTTSGKHGLMFLGLGGVSDMSGGDTTFIDNIVINRIGSRPLRPNAGGAETDIENARHDGPAPVSLLNPKREDALKQ